jgi:transcriptional regulator with XRE-family HTH domain
MITDERSTRAQDVLAANLRRLRIARHLSLSELARATGASKATLSGIERGRCNPTVDTLASLAAALRVSFGELLEEPAEGEVRVVRATRRDSSQPPGDVSRVKLDSLAPAGAGELTEIALDARQLEEGEPLAAGSRAHVYVLQGKLIAGPLERITELAAGDYASFPVDVPHVYESRRHPVRALVLTQAPGYAVQ